MDLNKLVENYFKKDDDPLLNKKKLWEMFDVVYGELSQLKGKYSIVQEAKSKVKQTEGEKFVLSLPKFTPSEDWGKPNSEARQIMEAHLRQIGGGADVAARLRWLERLQGKVPAKGREIKSPRRVISTLILLESLSACFNAFHESATGFVFEGFLAAILGGHQIEAEKGSLPIEDIVAFSQWGGTTDMPISLKALKTTTNIKGSYTSLVKALNTFPEMRYIVAYKKKEGDDVSAIKIVEFTISRENVLGILKINTAGRKLITFKDDAFDQKLNFQESYDLLNSIKEAKPFSWEVLYAHLQRTQGYKDPITTTLPEEEAEEEAAEAKIDLEAQPELERSMVPEHQLPLAALSILTEGKSGGTQWHISPAELEGKDLRKAVHWAELATLDFSPDQLYKTADRYIKVLNSSIRSLFQATADLSTNINAYFATPNRGTALNKGEDAIGNAQTIETQMTLQRKATETESESEEEE